jgi:hypothetical protein
VTNIPDNRLEVFIVNPGGRSRHAFRSRSAWSPWPVAARTNTEVWVVNHLSDSVSIVDLAATPPRVVRTLIVGDEPRDIVFAGRRPARGALHHHRAPRPAAHRCTISARAGRGDPQLTTQGVGRADVWVFDPANLGATFGGTPVRILTFFADTPRALATDGTNVWVAAFHSGNQTTTILEPCVRNGFGVGAGAPEANCPIQQNVPGRRAGAEHESGGRRRARDRPDRQVQRVAMARPARAKLERAGPVQPSRPRRVHRERQHVRGRHDLPARRNDPLQHGPQPVSGKIYVTNTGQPEPDPVRGPGDLRKVARHLRAGRAGAERSPVYRPGAPVRNAHHGAQSANGGVDSQHLNKHIDYSQRHTNAGANHAQINAQAAHSLATPLQPVVSSNGSTLYVPAFGSSKIGVFSTAAIEDPNFETNFNPTTASANYITTTGGGPAGLVLDEVNNRLYVLTRFDNSVQVINPTTKATLATFPLFNPEPASVLAGRRFLYDAQGHFGQRRSIVRELPHLRRTSTASPGTSAIPTTGSRSTTSQWASPNTADPAVARDHLPSDEGPDDDADAARPGDEWRHALARRSCDRLFSAPTRARSAAGNPSPPKQHPAPTPRVTRRSRSTTSSSRSRA